MIGMVGGMINRVGGYIIPKDASYENINQKTMDLFANCKILCTNCYLVNEESLIDNGFVRKTETGYDILKDVNEISIARYIDNMVPLTITNGREFYYIDSVHDETASTITCNLPRGARINGVAVSVSGEISVPYKNNILIEY